jgi:hypothetical protein
MLFFILAKVVGWLHFVGQNRYRADNSVGAKHMPFRYCSAVAHHIISIICYLVEFIDLIYNMNDNI